MAVLRSFVTSCELVKVDPFAWFQDVLSRIGECSMQQLVELLPHRWAASRAQSDPCYCSPCQSAAGVHVMHTSALDNSPVLFDAFRDPLHSDCLGI